MSLNVGDAVLFRASGEEFVGRICKIYSSGFCCVQFDGECARVRLTSLSPTDIPAPQCSPECRAGC